MKHTGTDRYVLTGLPVPVIAPADLRNLETLLRTAYQASQQVSDRVFTIRAVQNGKLVPIRTYMNGTDITDPDQMHPITDEE